MLKFRHSTLLLLSGGLWFAIGGLLLSLGLFLVARPLSGGVSEGYPILSFLSSIVYGSSQAAVLVIACSLFIGHFKGKYALRKSAERVINRLVAFPNPTSIGNLYSKGYYLLIGSMIALGMSMRWLQFPEDVRGAIDIVIGSALLQGSLVYFRTSKKYEVGSVK